VPPFFANEGDIGSLYDIRRQTKSAFAEDHPGAGLSGRLAERLSDGHLNDSVPRPRWRHDDQFEFVAIAIIGQFFESATVISVRAVTLTSQGLRP